MYLLSLAFFNIRRTGYFAMGATAVLMVVCFLMNLSRNAELWIRPTLQRIQSEQVVTLYLKQNLSSQDSRKIEDEVRQSLGAQAVRVEKSEPAQFLNDLRASDPELVQQFETFGSDLGMLIPRFITVHGAVPENWLKHARLQDDFVKVDSSRSRYAVVYHAFRSILTANRALLFAVVMGLGLTLWLLATALVRGHQETARWMQLMGASLLQSETPVLLGMAVLSLVGVAAATILWELMSHDIQWGVTQLVPALQAGMSGQAALPVWTAALPFVFVLVLSQLIAFWVIVSSRKKES